MLGSPATAPLSSPAARRARQRVTELARGRADHRFLEDLSRTIHAAVPFDAAFWSGADPEMLLATSPARIEGFTSAVCGPWWEAEFLVEDFNAFRDVARAPRPVGTLWRATEGRPRRSYRYRVLHPELGLADELRTVFRADHGTWGFAALWRREDRPRFTAAEERFLADLSATVAQAFQRAARWPRQPAPGGSDAPGLVTFDPDGDLECLNDEAEAWLRELPSAAWRQGPPARPLPTPLLTVSSQARAIAAGVSDGVARARVRTRSGRWLVVHGFTLRGRDSERGRTALVIEPARPAEVASILVGAYGLTPREEQITRLVSQGISTDEIARVLYLSRHTVRDYLKQVFEKVGVSSRGELVATIFRERYLAAMEFQVEGSSAGDHLDVDLGA